MNQRLPALRVQFLSFGIDAVLVTNTVNIRYLTGFLAEDAWLLVTRKKAFYVTDFRHTEQVRRALKGVGVVQFEKSLAEAVVDLAQGERVRVLGVDEQNLSVRQFKKIKAAAGKGFSLKAADGVVEALRALKDKNEIALIRKAIWMNLDMFRYVRRFVRPGVTEQAILERLEGFVRARGGRLSFPPIVASGPNSALPHARVTGRKLHKNEPLLLDAGVDINGYKSDLTRMFFLGKMTRSFEKNLGLIRSAQEEAFKAIRPGVEARVVDAASRYFLARHGLASHFGHSLGHGVGLDVHEDPRISQRSGAFLMENMVITIEPGVYFSERYGVRLEEMVLVTKNGCEVLSGNFDH